MSEGGKGVPQDDVEAVRLYRLAAERGGPEAQLNLGRMYERGKGVPKDDIHAVKWYRLAAEQGDAGAQFSLGRMYATAEGASKDYPEAYFWVSLAEASGKTVSERARTFRDILRNLLTATQIAEVQTRIAMWRPKGEKSLSVVGHGPR